MVHGKDALNTLQPSNLAYSVAALWQRGVGPFSLPDVVLHRVLKQTPAGYTVQGRRQQTAHLTRSDFSNMLSTLSIDRELPALK